MVGTAKALGVLWLILILPVAAQAGIYDLLKPLLTASPTFQNSHQPTPRAYSSDLIVKQSELGSLDVPIAIQVPENSEGRVVTGPYSPPLINISWAMAGEEEWQSLSPNSDIHDMSLPDKNFFTVTLPKVNARVDPYLIVIRIRLISMFNTEFKFMVLVLPEYDQPETVVYDFDGTLALGCEGQSKTLVELVSNSLQGNLRKDRVIVYLTTRHVSEIEFVRDWLLKHKLPPGIILPAPESLKKSDEDARKAFKLARLLQLKTITNLQSFWGDSPKADIEAAMEAGVEKVHHIENLAEAATHTGIINTPAVSHYRLNLSKQFVHKMQTRQCELVHHFYQRESAVVAEVQDDKPLVCMGIDALKNNNTRVHQVPAAHLYLAAKAMQFAMPQ
ncbi:LNS2 domain-containing protein [Endozoicomonas arenosclerae]|uniref:LNS2 domain-containing protein n=1 Tax=Endozoicomonas arenosclerae TaxID=1633495 RepID=UPI0007832DAB|nr:hypothetical protein [Endozoicomonas arenosclerae]